MSAARTVAFGILIALLAGRADAGSAWQLRAMGGVVCRAFLPGADVDTQLLRNKDGKLILIAGFPTKSLSDGDTATTLSIDGGPAVGVQGHAVVNIVMVLVDDDARAKRIGRAKTLDWHFPWGNYHAAVDGLGDAFAKLKICPG